jgi:hypothetical protein
MFSRLILVLFVSSSAQAFDACQYLKILDCRNLNMSSGAALPSLSASEKLNPASIPSRPTPIGLEVIGSNVDTTQTSNKFNLALVKGFERMGAAVSTEAGDTFYTYNYAQAFEGTPSEGLIDTGSGHGIVPSLNLGTAVAIPVGPLAKILNPSLGLLAHYDNLTQRWGLGSGINLTIKFVSAGFSFLQVPVVDGSNLILLSTMFGLQFGLAQLEYAQLKYTDSLLDTRPAHITTLSLHFRKVILTAGMKVFKNVEDEVRKSYLGGIQFLVSRHFATGYLYNFRPGCHSLGMQIFL